MLVKRNDESLLNFKDDISSIVPAEKISYSQQVLDELRKLEKELTALEKVAQAETEKIKAAKSGASPAGLMGMTVNELAGQKSSLKTSDGTTHYDKAVLKSELALTPIGRFSIDAKAALEETKSYALKTQEKFDAVLKYFGENATLTPIQFFSTLSMFCRAFDKALEDVLKEEKKKAREARLQKMREEKEKEAERKKKLKEEGKDDAGGNANADKVPPLGAGVVTPKQRGKKLQASRRASTMTSTPSAFGL